MRFKRVFMWSFQRLNLVFQNSLLKTVLKWLKESLKTVGEEKFEIVKSVVEK